MLTKTDILKIIEEKAVSKKQCNEAIETACKNLEMKLRKEYDRKLENLSLQMQGKIDTLNNVIRMKDEILAKTNQEIGELKASYNFVSGETSALAGKVNLTNILVDKCKSEQARLEGKAVDLEDRSRRNNLVFFNIPEEESSGTKESCEQKIGKLFTEVGLCDNQSMISLDRAHRLGPHKSGNNRPRPIIVRCTYYKDKDWIIRSANKHFKDSPVNVSEDYSKPTISEHRSLISKAKRAKENGLGDSRFSILNYRLGYRRVTLTYSSNKNKPDAPVFRKSFTLSDTSADAQWFVPKERK